MFYTVPFLLASLASLTQAYTLSNVTVLPTNTSFFTYYSPCQQQTEAICNGAWWKAQDPLFSAGEGMVAGDPNQNYTYIEPYMTWSFMGSAFYLYELVNYSSAFQVENNQRTSLPNINITSAYDLQPDSPTSLRMVWSMENLDPLTTNTFGLQHYKISRPTFIYFDHMVITQTTLEPGDIVQKPKSNKTKIIGGVIGGVLGLAALLLGLCLFRTWRVRQAAASSKGRYAWQGEAPPMASIKFVDPSSEIEASERIAREGALEEEREKEASKKPDTLV